MPETAPAISQRPRALAPSVERLIHDVIAGRIRIPGWQRPMKWDVGDARKLLDSIWRGYPVGTLLFWKREGPSESVRLGTVMIEAARRSDALYVVDGQQRITSLVRVLAGKGAPLEGFALFFDPVAQEIVEPPREGPPPEWLPLTEALDSRRLLKWLHAHPSADHLDACLDLGSRIREYPVPVYEFETDDERIPREVFERTNTTGKSMQLDEVFDGRFRGKDAMEPAGLRDVAQHLEASGFGALASDLLHSMMLATRHTDLTKADTGGWSPEDARRGVDDVQRAGERVLSFLLHDAHIPHVDWLPYRQPLLALTRFFHFYPEPHPRNCELLVRWLWRGACAGLHGGATVGTRAVLTAIRTGCEDSTVQALLELVKEGRDFAFEPEASHFNFGHARSKLSALALLELGPLHLIAGTPMAPADLRPLPIIGAGPRKSSLGNRLVHITVSGGLLRGLLKCEDQAVLASHAIAPGDREMLEKNHETFIATREARLVGLALNLARKRARWDDTDRAPLRAFWQPDRDFDQNVPEGA